MKQLGHAVLSVTPPYADKDDQEEKEKYLITLPTLHIEGLIYGSPFVELEKTTRIASTSGYVIKIDYSGKGWLSGKKNNFFASLFKASEGEKHPLYTADGQWSDSFTIHNTRTGEADTFPAKSVKISPLHLANVKDQDPYESRRAWHDVAQAIDKGDMDAVAQSKATIENAQRALRKEEKEKGIEWKSRFFNRIDEREDAVLAKLGRLADYTSIEPDKTGGVWRFSPEKAEGAKPPYHDVHTEGLGLGISNSAAAPSSSTAEPASSS